MTQFMYDVENVTMEMHEKIFEGLYSYNSKGKTNDINISFTDVHRVDPLNYQAMGTYHDDDGNPIFDFEIEDGNRAGSVLIRVAPPETLETPKRYVTEYFFAPDDKKIVAENIQRAWTILNNSPHMQENQRKMRYDLHFDPSNKVRSYWTNYAESISCVIHSRQVECD